METLRTKDFKFEEKSYEVRVISDGKGKVVVRVYTEDAPANGFVYETSIVDQGDLKRIASFDAIEYFMKSAETDVFEKRWGKFLEAQKKAAARD